MRKRINRLGIAKTQMFQPGDTSDSFKTNMIRTSRWPKENQKHDRLYDSYDTRREKCTSYTLETKIVSS